jgi:hypothetical protein
MLVLRCDSCGREDPGPEPPTEWWTVTLVVKLFDQRSERHACSASCVAAMIGGVDA